MLIHIVSDKPDIPREKLWCDTCTKRRLCIRTLRADCTINNTCRECYKKEGEVVGTKYKSVTYCEICSHLSLEDEVKTCNGCRKLIGQCCAALYHCQSVECTCRRCYGYECEECCKDLSRDRVYLSDGGGECQPLCDPCMKTARS